MHLVWPGPLSSNRALVDRWLNAAIKATPSTPARLRSALTYALLGPGKRLRPVLALEAFRAAGGKRLAAIRPFCCGVEMLHAFSLVHDDLPSLDNDDLRRGRPTLHRRFGEAEAILAADGLFALAFELFTRGPAPAALKTTAAAIVAAAVGPAGMTAGQWLDITNRHPGPGAMARIHRLKTAEFIAACLEGGCALAGMSSHRRNAVRRAGLQLGMLFQLTDDLLDAARESGTTMLAARRAVQVARAARRRCRLASLAFRQMGPQFHRLATIPGLLLERRD